MKKNKILSQQIGILLIETNRNDSKLDLMNMSMKPEINSLSIQKKNTNFDILLLKERTLDMA